MGWKVRELINQLGDYNQDAEVDIIVHNRKENFSLSFGSGEGCTKKNCSSVSFYIDRLCTKDNQL